MSYYVVAFEHNDPMLKRHQFNEIGSRLVYESMERIAEEIRRTGDSAFTKSLKQVETYTFGEVMPGYEQSLPEWAKAYLPTEEYKRFGKVYFLNELALKMYREGGVAFEIYRVIADEELPKGCCPGITAPYWPKENQAGFPTTPRTKPCS
jgi:hypothetical protein